MNCLNLGTVAIWMPGGMELLVILLLLLLLFGKRLPNIARNMGTSLVEFKKGLKHVEDVKEDLTQEIRDAGQPSGHDDAESQASNSG